MEADLENRGVIGNREVEIARGLETGTRVQFASQSGEAHLKVTIETKGSRSKDWPKNMREQLVERYLKKEGQAAGIYLLGWLYSPSWYAKRQQIQVCKEMNLGGHSQ